MSDVTTVPTVTTYHVTGVLTSGRRFNPIKTNNLSYAASINLYRGSVWEVDDNGKRKLLWRVYN